jgi:hypothetical protein
MLCEQRALGSSGTTFEVIIQSKYIFTSRDGSAALAVSKIIAVSALSGYFANRSRCTGSPRDWKVTLYGTSCRTIGESFLQNWRRTPRAATLSTTS